MSQEIDPTIIPDLSEPFTAYISEIKPIQLLSAEEERQLFLQMEAGDQKAREQIITHNVKLAARIAIDYVNERNISKSRLTDLVQEGNIGLMHAVEKFDYRKGYRFSTYATWWIKQYVTRWHLKNREDIVLPIWASDDLRKLQKEYLNTDHDGHIPTIDELTALSGMSRSRVENVYPWFNHNGATSLDQAINDDGDLLLVDALPSGENVEENYEEKEHREEQRALVHELLAQLPPRQRLLVVRKFGLDGQPEEKLFTQKAKNDMGISRERVRQLYIKAMATLKAYAQEKGYEVA